MMGNDMITMAEEKLSLEDKIVDVSNITFHQATRRIKSYQDVTDCESTFVASYCVAFQHGS
jgi:hypothetical protein